MAFIVFLVWCVVGAPLIGKRDVFRMALFFHGSKMEKGAVGCSLMSFLDNVEGKK